MKQGGKIINEYKIWLESVIAEERIAVQGGADDSKLRICEECLKQVIKLENHGVDFCNLEIGKEYVSVFKDGSSSIAFVVLDKGCDDGGNYIWYHNVENDSIAFKTHEQDFYEVNVKYFKENHNDG